MNNNDFTTYLAIIFLGLFFINYLYKQIRFLIAKSKGAIYHKISQEQAKELMDSDNEIINIDVRTPAEFKGGHIKGAKNYSDMNKLAIAYPDKYTILFINCQSGSRSSKASKKLVLKGYTNIYDIGGISTWNYGTTKR